MLKRFNCSNEWAPVQYLNRSIEQNLCSWIYLLLLSNRFHHVILLFLVFPCVLFWIGLRLCYLVSIHFYILSKCLWTLYVHVMWIHELLFLNVAAMLGVLSQNHCLSLLYPYHFLFCYRYLFICKASVLPISYSFFNNGRTWLMCMEYREICQSVLHNYENVFWKKAINLWLKLWKLRLCSWSTPKKKIFPSWTTGR